MNLSDNGLLTVPKSFAAAGCLSCLTVLDLSRNKLKEIAPEVYPNLPQLESLNLNYNLLTKVDKGLARLPVLSRLGITGNLISSVPFFLLTMAKLNHLELEWDAVADILMQPQNISLYTQPNALCMDLDKLSARFKSYCVKSKTHLAPTTEITAYYYLEQIMSGTLDISAVLRACIFSARNSYPGLLHALMERLGACPYRSFY
jgi:Leucine-rich repeat (LRR) protein